MGKNEQLMIKTDGLLTTGLSYTLPEYVAYTCQVLLLLLLLYTSSYGSRQLLFTFSDSLILIIVLSSIYNSL